MKSSCSLNKNLNQKEIDVIIKKNEKIKKFMVSKKLLKTIFVKNRIINYIIN